MSVNKNIMNAKKKDNNTLGKGDLAFFMKLIIKERDKMRGKLNVMREAAKDSFVKEASGGNSSYNLHMADQGTDAMEREQAFLLMSRQGHYLDKLEAALKRIDEGTYGICRSCFEPIDKERLKAVPIATQCIRCKTK